MSGADKSLAQKNARNIGRQYVAVVFVKSIWKVGFHGRSPLNAHTIATQVAARIINRSDKLLVLKLFTKVALIN